MRLRSGKRPIACSRSSPSSSRCRTPKRADQKTTPAGLSAAGVHRRTLQAIRSLGLQVDRRALAGLAVGFEIEADLLSVIQAAQSGTLDRAYMNEDILAALIWRNKAVALSLVE